MPLTVMLFVMEVLERHDHWDEAGLRERMWVSLDEAGSFLVEHPASVFLSRALRLFSVGGVTIRAIAAVVVVLSLGQASSAPDLIVHNARVYIVDAGRSTAEAIAVRGDRIALVGSERRGACPSRSLHPRDRRRRRDDRAWVARCARALHRPRRQHAEHRPARHHELRAGRRVPSASAPQRHGRASGSSAADGIRTTGRINSGRRTTC